MTHDVPNDCTQGSGSSKDSPTSSTPFLDEDCTNSNQTLLPKKKLGTLERSRTTSSSESSTSELPNWKKYITVGILFFINLLNYMDRFTIAGVLIQIQEFFGINNAMGGLLQTVFIVSYMLVAPLFGYLGDRYNRKVLMVIGMAIWSGFTLAASFILSPDLFPVFLLMRALVGIGEASYSTIAPTIIGDLFVGQQRTRMLSVFFLAIPIGSGLGYIVGSQMALLFGGWEWALRVTPILGVVAILLVIFVCPNPPRGASETQVKIDDRNKNSYFNDLSYLIKNKSFVLVTIGFTFVAFVVGSLTLWGPIFFSYAEIATGNLAPCSSSSCDYAEVNFLFGIITCIAGFAGIGIGAETARRWKLSGQKNADPIVCAIGLFLAAPLLYAGCESGFTSINTAWVMIFFADVALCLTWTLVGDMTLYVTEPSRRSSANAVMILTGHLFGDAGSPYLIGLYSDSLMSGREDTYINQFLSLKQALYITLFASIIGGGGFLIASLYVVRDKEKVEAFLTGSTESGGSARTESSGESHVSIPMSDASGSDSAFIGNGLAVNSDSIDSENAPQSNKTKGLGNVINSSDTVNGNIYSHPLLNGKETVI